MISQKSNDQLIDFESQYIAITFSVSNCTITLHKLLKEKVCKSKPILYKDTAFLVPTSNILERFFSAAKFAFNDHRQQLSPVNLEGQLFLKLNSRFWDEHTVSSVCENNCN